MFPVKQLLPFLSYMSMPFITTFLKQSRGQQSTKEEMDWIRTRRRGPEWKQGWTKQTLSSISAPPLPLVAVFAIVIFLLSLSQYTTYKEQMRYTMFSIKILLFLAPVFLIFFLCSSLLSSGGWLNFWSSSQQGRRERRELARGVAAFPWGVALLVMALLVLVSYQSSFQSKWFLFGSSA